MPDQFVRFKAIGLESLGAGRYAGHKRCQHRTEHTLEGPRAGIPPVHLVDEVAELEPALAAIDRDARARSGERGRRPAGCYDVLMTGAPRYDGQNGEPLSYEDELKWATACIVWLRSRLPPGCILANAYLHRDEASPHVHATIVPWCKETKLLDWRTCRARLAGVEPRPRLKLAGLSKAEQRRAKAEDKRLAGEEMRAVLDSFHEAVSVPFGIGRGDRGNRRRHRAVSRRRAAELEERGAELAAKLAADREALAKTSAKAAELDADRRVEKARERAELEEERDAKAKASAERNEARAAKALAESKRLEAANKRGRDQYRQIVEDIEAGRPDSAAGREQRERLEAAERDRDRALERGAAWNEERMRLKLALGVPQDELGRVVDVGGAHELVRRVMERGRDLVLDALRRFGDGSAERHRFVRAFGQWLRRDTRERGSGREG